MMPVVVFARAKTTENARARAYRAATSFANFIGVTRRYRAYVARVTHTGEKLLPYYASRAGSVLFIRV